MADHSPRLAYDRSRKVLRLEGPANGASTVRVFKTDGELVRSSSVGTGSNTYHTGTVDVSDLAEGMYVANLETDGKVACSGKFVFGK
jgi:hypothetical protein